MNVYCLNHVESVCNHGWDYVFRADTQDYSYLVRCVPNGEDNHVYIHPYRRERLEQHMEQAAKGIRFITTDFKERFTIPDGDTVRIMRDGTYTDKVCRYVDDYHTEVGGSLYSAYEFAELLSRAAAASFLCDPLCRRNASASRPLRMKSSSSPRARCSGGLLVPAPRV